jgi:LuxR family maltose regulon positive regulatory protein
VTSPLVQSKLYIPRPRAELVARPRLSERLSRGAESRLTLISAPAGFGKTTLLTEWVTASSARQRSVAWLSLDERDNEPASFWAYLIAAVQTVAPQVGAGVLPLLESGQTPTDGILATVLNDLREVPDDIGLVLDDYHLVEGRGVQDGMVFLLEHLPRQVHVLISTRADPALPLARLRARGELVEIRATDLRFTPDEAAAYLNEAVGLDLTADDIAALEERTEGWIAALQLAALSMQGRHDLPGFIAGFAGNDRYIVDYLVEEVLQRQPDQVRSFLLRTSILDRLSGPLCDAVTGHTQGKATLEGLDRANLFLIPLDDSRRWYRFHHLFADVLRAHLMEEQHDRVAELHRRASEWYEHNGEPSEAIRHAVAAGDFEHAADLAELALPIMRRTRREAEIRDWLRLIPDELVRTRPVLNVGFVGALMSVNEFDGVEDRLGDAERSLSTGDAGMVVVDGDQFRGLPGMVEMYKAGLALVRGDLPGTVTHARSAIDLAAEDDHLCRAGSATLLGLASWAEGELESAHRAYAEGMAGLDRAGFVSDVLGCAVTLADIRIDQGRLSEALRTYEQALRLVPEGEGSVLRGTADVYVGMSEILWERNDLDAARELLRRVNTLGERMGLPKNPFRRRVAMARVRLAERRPADAVRLLDEAERVYLADFAPNVRPIPSLRARVRVAQGELGEALRWAREHGLSPDDDLSYLREFDHITLAHVLLARYDAERNERSLQDAARLLERLRPAAEEGGRTGRVIEILALQALAHQARGDRSAGLAALQRAVTLAEPEGYVRLFVDHGPSMTALLRSLVREQVAPSYVRRLLAAASTTGTGPAEGQPLVEPLSARELDVLRLLGTELDGPEIARELVVSLSTVRTHTQRIYTKLGVTNRRAAVRRAEELDLLSGSRHRRR